MSPKGNHGESPHTVPLCEPTTRRGSPFTDPTTSNGRPVWLQEGKKSGGHIASRLLIQKVL